MEGDTRQLVALTDVKHRNRVASIQQLLHQVSAQETRPPDDRTPFVALHHTHTHKHTQEAIIYPLPSNEASHEIKPF